MKMGEICSKLTFYGVFIVNLEQVNTNYVHRFCLNNVPGVLKKISNVQMVVKQRDASETMSVISNETANR